MADATITSPKSTAVTAADSQPQKALPETMPTTVFTAKEAASDTEAAADSPVAPPAKYLPVSHWRTILTVLSLTVGTLLVAIDTTIISVAIPQIATDFTAFSHVGWYGSAYLFTVTAFQPAFGSVFRFFNAKWAYLGSVVIFEVGSILCAAAPVSEVFILGRAVQGVGAAGLYQGALSIIGFTVPLDKRPMIIGIVLSVFGLAVCFGPPVGGILTDDVTWRWCFWINLPIGAAAFVLLLFIMKMPQSSQSEQNLSFREKVAKLDFLGIVLTIAAVCCLVLALQFGSQEQVWNSRRTIGLFVGAGLLLMLLGLSQWWKKESATIPLRILRQRSIFMGALFLFFLEMAIYVYLFYLPFYFQSAQMVDAKQSGIRAIPLGLSQIFAVVTCSYLVTVFGYYVPFMVAGQLVAIVGNVLLSRISVDTATAVWATYLVITGIGTGMGLQMPFTAVQLVLSKEDAPVGNAILVFFQQLGAAIAVAIGQSIFSKGLQDEITNSGIPIPSQQVEAVGPTAIRQLTTDSALIRLIQEAYCYAFRDTMYFALAALAVAMPFAVCMQWLNAKAIAKALGSE